MRALFDEGLEAVSPELGAGVAESEPAGKLRAFAGAPGFLRRAAGPGWGLVGDAGYFRDPITAHGITDALREAELFSRAFAEGGDAGLGDYQTGRDERVRGLLDVTDEIASFDWDLERARALHLSLSREMKAQVEAVRSLDACAAVI